MTDLQQGLEHHKRGELAAAERVYREVLSANPRHPEALHLLGVLARQCGRPEAAAELIGEAIAIEPRNALYHANLANALRELERFEDAEAACREALALRPELASAWNGLGVVLRRQRRLEEAQSAFERALELAPRFAEARYNQGLVLEQTGRAGDARTAFEQALALNPQLTDAHNDLGLLLQRHGDFGAAAECFQRALRLSPARADLHRNVAALGPQYQDRFDAGQVEALLARSDLSAAEAATLHFALAWHHEHGRDFEAAFAHYREANRLRRSTFDYDPDANARLFDRVMAVFSGEFFAARRGFGSESALPVFVMGMPRSGTTLVEQILSSHPAVHGAGELTWMRDVLPRVSASADGAPPFPECFASLDAAMAARLAREHLDDLRRRAPEALRVTNKLPQNFLYLGAWKLLFPAAKVIHCVRDPLDTCVSNYCLDFSPPHGYAYQLEELGRFYRDYLRLTGHWQELFGPDLLEVRYESLIDEPERVSRRMTDFLELPWDARCLDFTRNPRSVDTASSWQVRQPIYRSSVARWRRFEAHLGALREALGETPRGAPP